jgi:hypothetical protein
MLMRIGRRSKSRADWQAWNDTTPQNHCAAALAVSMLVLSAVLKMFGPAQFLEGGFRDSKENHVHGAWA